MPLTMNDLVQQYYATTNPVTKWSLRQCIFDRIYP